MTMRQVLGCFFVLAFIPFITCPPVTPSKDDGTKPPEDAEDIEFGLEYERYLKEVVNILETDESFKKKLEEADVSDIKTLYEKSGEIAKHLNLVGHQVRSKLDELKRVEIDRLRQLMKIKLRREKGMNIPSKAQLDELFGHLDPKSHNFDESDLEKLIKRASTDLEAIDARRKEEFKNYEMEKELLRREKLKSMDDAQRKVEEERYRQMKEKHEDHPKLKHPGSRDQLEEVWEEDGLDPDNFDPKTFFRLHDTNGDMVLDEGEIEALFQRELDKVYDPNAVEDDMMERYEEMSRMREHIMKEVDLDHDGLVSWEEFYKSTQSEEFEKDEGWDPLDKKDFFTEEELARFQKEYEESLKQHAQPGEINIPLQETSSIHPPVLDHKGDNKSPQQNAGLKSPHVPHPPKNSQDLKFNPGAEPAGLPEQKPGQMHQQEQKPNNAVPPPMKHKPSMRVGDDPGAAKIVMPHEEQEKAPLV